MNREAREKKKNKKLRTLSVGKHREISREKTKNDDVDSHLLWVLAVGPDIRRIDDDARDEANVCYFFFFVLFRFIKNQIISLSPSVGLCV